MGLHSRCQMGLGLCPASCLHHQVSHSHIDLTMDIANKNEFIFFMQRAVEDQSNDCYIELYNILLRAFITADRDFDGQVSEEEFGGMIDAAAALPKKFGFDWWQGSSSDQFKAIDENGDGAVSFDEWLGYAYKNYQNQKLPVAFDKQEKDPFVADCKESLTPRLTPTRRFTGSAGSASRPLTLTGTVRSRAVSSLPCSMWPRPHRRGLVSLHLTRPLRRGTRASQRWTRTVTAPSPSTSGCPSSSRRSSLPWRPCNSEHYTVLTVTALNCSVKRSPILYSTIQCGIVQYNTISIVQCITLQICNIQCSTVPGVLYSRVQYHTVCAVQRTSAQYCSVNPPQVIIPVVYKPYSERRQTPSLPRVMFCLKIQLSAAAVMQLLSVIN